MWERLVVVLGYERSCQQDRGLCTRRGRLWVVEVPPNACFGFWGGCLAPVCVRACSRATGMTLTLGGVEHPLGRHVASGGLASWPVRAKLC